MRYVLLMIMCGLWSCAPSENSTPDPEESIMSITLSFDKDLPRLGNFGESVSIPSGHAAQSPEVHSASLHYIELATSAWTPLESGAIIYQGAETNQGGDRAVDFDKASVVRNGELFTTIPLNNITPGTYEWVRVSLTYQNYDINYRLDIPPYINNEDFTGRVASFVGFNTFISEHTIQDSTVNIQDNKKQGYWALETNVTAAGQEIGRVFSGDGAGVTVVNPIADTSPVPDGSCVVTGKLSEPLIITGSEGSNKKLDLKFSINNSFEWKEINNNGKYEPLIGEQVVDMGLRGLHPHVNDF